MKKIRKLGFVMMCAAFLCFIPHEEIFASNENGDLVIVLDAGHDSTHAGAQGNSLKEEEIVYKIVQYCKEELNKYAGVAVYSTRDGYSCANGGKGVTSGECNTKRVEYAASVGADIYVSFHINSSTSTSASGVGIYYPNANYRPVLGDIGKGLANQLLINLKNLGLKQWSDGIMIRNSENNTLYPDGSLADYLGVIRQSKEADIPAVLIEHAFISNASDVANFLNTDEKLKTLGVADAKAIIEYYNLKIASEYEYGDAEVSISNEVGNAIFSMSAAGIENAYGVRFAVWSAENGQDDLVWYNAKKQSNGNWVADASVKYHTSVGAYYIHTYIYRSDGSVYMVAANTQNVSGKTTGTIQIQNKNIISGNFDVVVSDVSAFGGVQKVYVPVWSESNQSDIVWYQAQKQEDGTYRVHVDVAKHNSNFQNYQAHAYVVAGNGTMNLVDAELIQMYRVSPVVKASLDESGSYISISAQCIPGTCGQSLKRVAFAVWSNVNGQDDIRWYTATPTEDKYVIKIPFSNHNDTGIYNIHTYAYYANGTSVLVNGTTIDIQEVSVGSIDIKNVDTLAGSFDVIISNVSALGGVKNVYVPVWSKSDQSDITWYNAQKQGDGTYKVHVDVANHNANFGRYYVHTYVTSGRGNMKQVGATSVNLAPPTTEIKATLNAVCSEIALTASNVAGTNGQSLRSVSFAVWSDQNGQDDLHWYTGTLSGNTFTVNVPIENHTDTGNYQVHVYAQKSNGANQFIGNTTFNRPLTKIMGNSNVTVDKLVAYYSSRASYPSYYANTDAPSLEVFCQMYIEECAAEGVRAEVAFSQAMLETGFLTFGGDVSITQHNFAGIGATGNGSQGNSFSSVREGIRAQVQHLKAYASTDALVQTCVDPRFSYVTRGTAPYVEWLGIQENPYGTGWASAKNYGYTIRDNYMVNLLK